MGFHSPLIRPAISWGGGIGGVPLGSHECNPKNTWTWHPKKIQWHRTPRDPVTPCFFVLRGSGGSVGLEISWNEKPPKLTSWWLQPIRKILVKLEIFPKVRGEHKKYLKPPPSSWKLGKIRAGNCWVPLMWWRLSCKKIHPTWRVILVDGSVVIVTMVIVFVPGKTSGCGTPCKWPFHSMAYKWGWSDHHLPVLGWSSKHSLPEQIFSQPSNLGKLKQRSSRSTHAKGEKGYIYLVVDSTTTFLVWSQLRS